MSTTYRYRAATAGGELVAGVVAAPSARDAADALRQQRLVPVSVEPVAVTTPAAGRARTSRPAGVEAAVRTLAMLLSAGVPVDRALAFVERQASHPDVAAAFAGIRAEVQRGGRLSDAARPQPLLGPFAAAMIRAGEESGTLDESLARLASWLEQLGRLRSEFRAALLYPALMGIVAGLGVIVLLTVVVPRFVSILGDVGGTLPLSTRILVGASGVVTEWWFLWVPLLAAAVLGIRWWLGGEGNRLRWHGTRLRIPVTGHLEQAVATSRFAGALGVLLRGGTPVLAALRVARDGVTNLAIAGELEAAAERVARGDRVAESHAGALPPLAVELLAAGEESGRLAEMCDRVAAVYEEQVGGSLRTLVRMVEPALILAFGVVVGFIALAMLQAVYSVNAGIL